MGILDKFKQSEAKFCINCGNKLSRFTWNLDSGASICDDCYKLIPWGRGGECPICKSGILLASSDVLDQEHNEVTCNNCRAIFERASSSIFSALGKWRLIEGDSEYLNKIYTVDDWTRIRNGETPKAGSCPGCNYAVDVKWKEGWGIECEYCGRKLRVEQKQLVEVEFPDKITKTPKYKVIVHSKSIVWPPCCSICLGPVEAFKDRVDNYSLDLVFVSGSKKLSLPDVPYCSSCYNKINKTLFGKEKEGILIWFGSNPDKGIIELYFRNPTYAKMFRELNGC